MNPPTGPAPASAPPAPPQEPRKPLTPEELQAGAKDLYKTLFQDDSPPADLFKNREDGPRLETTAEPLIEAPPAAVETPPEVETPPAPETPPPAAPPAPKLTTAEIITKTAREVGQQVADAVRPRADQEPEPQPEPTVDLIPDDAEDLKAIQYLEQTNPQKYAGKAKEFTDYVTAHYAYQEKWLQEHPGEQYNADAEEHQQWYADNQPEIRAKDVDNAKVDLRVREAYEREVRPKLREIENEKKMQDAAPKIVDGVLSLKVAIADAAAPELGKLLRDANGKAAINAETVAKVQAEDPIAAEVLGNLIGSAEPLLLELGKIKEVGGISLDPRNNPVHAELDQYRKQAEVDMMAMKPADRLMDGKEFLPLHDFLRRQNAIERSRASKAARDDQIGQLYSKYWTLEVDHLQSLIVADVAEKAKAIIAKQDAVAQKKYKKSAPPAAPANNPPPPPPPPPPQLNTARPRPPSLSGQPDLVTTDKSGASTSKTFGEQATEVLFK